MKKIVALLLTAILVMALAACAAPAPATPPAAETPTTETPGETPAATTPTPAEPGGPQDALLESGGTIRIICPFGVGGTADAIARMYAAVAGRLFPQFNFVVYNMTGGDGFLAAAYFYELDPTTTDLLIYGYGMAYRHDLGRAHGTEPVDFDRHQFAAIGTIDDRTWIVYARPDTTLEDILELGRNGMVRMSGGNPLSDPHLAFGSLMAGEGGEVLVIPYEGGALQRQALINNEVDVFIGTTQAGIEEVAAGYIIPILAINDRAFEGFDGPEGPLPAVPAVAGSDRHAALSQDHTGSILPAGGVIATRQGASQAWIDKHIEIARAVWADPEYYEWIAEIMLNRFELYGAEADAFFNEAAARAMEAFESLR